MKKILIVDDEKKIVAAYNEHLAREGYEIERAYDGEEALLWVKEFAPDLILLGILMSKLDGLSVLRQLKADPELAKIPVFSMTNLQLEDQAAEAASLGAVGYLVKVHNTSKDLAGKVAEELKRRQ